jgi:methionine salvage enolase-phosphatase E1
VRSRQEAEQFHISGVAERLTPYETSKLPDMHEEESVDTELVERAATLLTVMPRNQLRKTIESLLSPHDLEKGRQAVDALIDAAFAAEDDAGHLRRIA